MTQVTIEDAACRLAALIHDADDSEIILTDKGSPVAKLVRLPTERPQPRRGSGRGFIAYMAPDFDETPEGFEEYMP